MTETELRDAYGMGRHEFRQYEGGEGCSCGKEWGHQWAQALADPATKAALDEGLADVAAGRVHQHTLSDPEPGCEYCEEAAK